MGCRAQDSDSNVEGPAGCAIKRWHGAMSFRPCEGPIPVLSMLAPSPSRRVHPRLQPGLVRPRGQRGQVAINTLRCSGSYCYSTALWHAGRAVDSGQPAVCRLAPVCCSRGWLEQADACIAAGRAAAVPENQLRGCGTCRGSMRSDWILLWTRPVWITRCVCCSLANAATSSVRDSHGGAGMCRVGQQGGVLVLGKLPTLRSGTHCAKLSLSLIAFPSAKVLLHTTPPHGV